MGLFSPPLHGAEGVLEVERMGELDGERAVHVAGIAGLVTEVVQDDEQIISRPVDVVEPDTVPNHITGTVVLDTGAGQPFSAEGDVHAAVDLMEAL